MPLAYISLDWQIRREEIIDVDRIEEDLGLNFVGERKREGWSMENQTPKQNSRTGSKLEKAVNNVRT